MIRITIAVIILVFSITAANAFTTHGNSPDTLSKELLVNNQTVVTNPTSDTIVLTVTKKPIFIPDSWEVSFCVGLQCLPSMVDSATTVIPPHDSAMVSVDFGLEAEGEVGTAMIVLQLMDNSSPPNIEKKILTMSNQATPSTEVISWNTDGEPLKNVEAESLTAWENVFYNTSSETKSFYIKKSDVLMPNEWNSSLCVNLDCLSPAVDSLLIKDLPPNDSVHIEFNISAGVEIGEAYAILEVGTIGSPIEKKRISFGVLQDGTPIRLVRGNNREIAPLVQSIQFSQRSLFFTANIKGGATFLLSNAQGKTLVKQQKILLNRGGVVYLSLDRSLKPGWYSLLVNHKNQKQTFPVLSVD